MAVLSLTVHIVSSQVLVCLFASNVFKANHGNTFWVKRIAFTRSAINPPTVSRFG